MVELCNQKGAGLMANRKSDYSIVLGERESRSQGCTVEIQDKQGEGNSNYTQRTKETSTGSVRPDILMQTSLSGIVEAAKHDNKRRFRSLYSLLNKTNLKQAYFSLNKKAVTGLDNVDYYEYGDNLDANLDELVKQLKEKRYRAKLIKRVYIPKDNGKKRPLGIPSIADKVLQAAVSEILVAIYEVDFLDSSYGYRPGRNAHQALHKLRGTLREKKNWVCEADIKSFFDNVNHDWMVKMLEQRINDKAFTGLIRKWLRAGIMEPKGKVVHPVTGTPQGGIVSPVLSNIYLHYVLDLWFEKQFKPSCSGKSELIRFADDYVAAFQYGSEAERFMKEMKERLEKFNLELAPEKTKKIIFNRFQKDKSERFDFLGFEFSWGLSLKGRDVLKLRTAKPKFQKAKFAFKEWYKTNRNNRIRNIFSSMNSKLQGYYAYYGIQGNSKRLWQFYNSAVKTLYRWLNRRSQRKSFNWETFNVVINHFGLKRPVIVKSLSQPGGVCHV